MEYGLIGEKLGHSYSKPIQEALLENYTFEIHPLPKDEVDAFMTNKEFKAINVTIPYKQTVIPYLDEMDEVATKIGAVNTIVNHDGYLVGHNTDYYGFKYMVLHHHIHMEGKKVLIMGNGGASQAIQAVVNDFHPKEVYIVDIILTDGILTIEEVYEKHSDVEIVVNTTPLGMYPNVDACSIDFDRLPCIEACLDVVYNPYRTEFALQAKQRGILSVTGLEMLVGQAKYALEFFKDIQIDDARIDPIYKQILLETTNIVTYNEADAKTLAKAFSKELVKVDNDHLREASIHTNQVLWIEESDVNEHTLHELERNGFIVTSSEDVVSDFKAYLNAL